MAIPDTMRAVVLEHYEPNLREATGGLRALERPTPRPRPGQVLVKMEAAPCNPSDLLLLQGKYGTMKELPTVPGWEGAGTVVASGGGLLAWWLQGKRVACSIQGNREGTWAQYCVAHAGECVPLKRGLDVEQAASLIINPLTAVGLLETAQREGHRGAIHTAAASQLGRMLLRIANEDNYPLICVVRRQEQVELLQSLGSKHVLDSSGDDFWQQLRELSQALGATAVFEAIAGEMTGSVLNVAPPGARVYLYGALSETPCGNFDPIQLIFHNKTVGSFFLSRWIRERGFLTKARAANRVQRMLIEGRIQTQIRRRLRLEEVPEGLAQYVGEMTAGKMLITPQESLGSAPRHGDTD